MNRYQQAKIYKIISNVSNDVYYGSTTEPTLAKRLAKHRSNYNDYKKGKCNFITSFKILETGDYDIILIELFPCNSKDELHSRESHYIRNNDCVNKVIPNRTHQEYLHDNKDRIKKRSAQYKANHKNEIQKKVVQYRIEHKNELQKKAVQYRIEHKEKIKEYKAQYRLNNKGILNKIIACPCGSKYTYRHTSDHKKTSKHKQYELIMNQLNEIIDMRNKTKELFNKSMERFHKFSQIMS